MSLRACPLVWPDGWPRAPRRDGSPYKVSREQAVSHLLHELKLAGARNVVLSTNVPLRRDGLPYADTREPLDPGAAVYWDDKQGHPMAMANDGWRTVRENIRALGLAIEHIRGLERTGSKAILERAYSGYARLPAGESTRWHDVLGVPVGSCRAVIDARYRELARVNHPDHGGDSGKMARINAAYREACQ